MSTVPWVAACNDVSEVISSIIKQLKLLPLVRESISRGQLFRILALDGGGNQGSVYSRCACEMGTDAQGWWELKWHR